MVVWQGRKMTPLEHPWSAIVRILLKPQLLGSPVIRSIVICVKGGAFSGTMIL